MRKKYYFKTQNIIRAIIITAWVVVASVILSFWESSQKLSDWTFNLGLLFLLFVITGFSFLSLRILKH